MQEVMSVNQKEYEIVKLLGHGKGGYSYLAKREGNLYVLKQIHHEPCEYCSFGNKIEAEQNDYNRLLQTGIRIPSLLHILPLPFLSFASNTNLSLHHFSLNHI